MDAVAALAGVRPAASGVCEMDGLRSDLCRGMPGRVDGVGAKEAGSWSAAEGSGDWMTRSRKGAQK